MYIDKIKKHFRNTEYSSIFSREKTSFSWEPNIQKRKQKVSFSKTQPLKVEQKRSNVFFEKFDSRKQKNKKKEKTTNVLKILKYSFSSFSEKEKME